MTAQTIPQPPEEVRVVSLDGGTPAVFLGLQIDPTYGRWLSVTADLDAETFHAFGRALCRTYARRAGLTTPPEEYVITDTSGFGPLRPRTIEEATVFSELKDALEMEGVEQWAALPTWLDRQGYTYTLYENGKIRDAWSIAAAFEKDYLGTYPEAKEYAQVRFEDEIGDTFSRLPELVQRRLAHHMDYDSLADDYAASDVYFGERNEHGVPVFQGG